MTFVSACATGILSEGEMVLLRVNRKAVLLVWPRGGEPKAYRGRCPHQDVPLNEARFDGSIITCEHHQWCFDGATGQGIHPPNCQLSPYPLRVEGDTLQVDLG